MNFESRNAQSLYTLRTDNIHIWFGTLEKIYIFYDRFLRALSQDEHTRSQKFAFANLQKKFICTRGLLRFLVSNYLHLSPNDVVFRYGPYGKPYVCSSNMVPIQFNISYCSDFLVLGFANGYEVGLDVEDSNSSPKMVDLTSYYLSENEVNKIQSSEYPDKDKTLLRTWVRKEALVKCVGCGLSYPLQSINTSLSDKAYDSIALTLNSIEHRLALIDLELPSPYLGSLAIYGEGKKISYRPFANSVLT